MPYAVAAAAVAAGGAIYSSDQAKSSQNAGTQKALDATNKQFNASQSALQPYQTAGNQALTRLQALLGMGAPAQKLPDGPTAVLRGNLAFNKETGDYLGRFGHGDKGGETLNDIAPTWGVNGVVDENGNTAWVKPGMESSTPQAAADQSPLLRKFTADDLANDPVYNSGLQFGQDEGTKAIERRAAAGGGYDSGAALKALTRFGNDYGSTKAADSRSRFVEDQNNAFGKLSGIAGMGQGSTNVGVSAGANNASNLSSLYSGQGNANAAASIAGGNAFSSGANSVGNYYQQQQLLQQLSGGGQRTTPTTTYDAES